MTNFQWRIVREFNQTRIFDLEMLIERLLFGSGERSISFETSNSLEFIGGVTRRNNEVTFVIHETIVNTPRARYTYALLLVSYTELHTIQTPYGVLIDNRWRLSSVNGYVNNQQFQELAHRLAQDILIDDDLLDQDSADFSIREIADRFQVPVRAIREKLGLEF